MIDLSAEIWELRGLIVSLRAGLLLENEQPESIMLGLHTVPSYFREMSETGELRLFGMPVGYSSELEPSTVIVRSLGGVAKGSFYADAEFRT